MKNKTVVAYHEGNERRVMVEVTFDGEVETVVALLQGLIDEINFKDD